jgi:hypothetical protein
MIPSCVAVSETNYQIDRSGADYIATLRSGRTLAVDLKTRDQGCSQYWTNDQPDLALERWSIEPDCYHKDGVIGWTLDHSKITDLVFFTFSELDTNLCYLLPFQHLRSAFIRFGRVWLDEYGPLWKQLTRRDSYKYYSSCLFVPAPRVLDAITEVSKGSYASVVSDGNA